MSFYFLLFGGAPAGAARDAFTCIGSVRLAVEFIAIENIYTVSRTIAGFMAADGAPDYFGWSFLPVFGGKVFISCWKNEKDQDAKTYESK